jgi:hypothetical protein
VAVFAVLAGFGGAVAPPPAVLIDTGVAAQPPTVTRLNPRSLPVRPFAQPVHDRVITVTPPNLRAMRTRALAGYYTTSTGEKVYIELSPAYADSAANSEGAQAYAEFLASRLHGDELGAVKVYIAPPAEVQAICGEISLACYLSQLEAMVVSGEQTPSTEAPLEFVITHEYGHHIAFNRRNDPWPAIDWGPKYWATYEQVCGHVRAGDYFPGAEQPPNYFLNPGEAWAEAYAIYHYRDQPWGFARSFAPDANDFAAIQRDVLRPWEGRTEHIAHGSLSPRGRQTTTRTFRTLDGNVTFRLAGPRRANFNIELLLAGQVVLHSRQRGSRDVLGGELCDTSRISARVRRVSGKGRFSLFALTP